MGGGQGRALAALRLLRKGKKKKGAAFLGRLSVDWVQVDLIEKGSPQVLVTVILRWVVGGNLRRGEGSAAA